MQQVSRFHFRQRKKKTTQVCFFVNMGHFGISSVLQLKSASDSCGFAQISRVKQHVSDSLSSTPPCRDSIFEYAFAKSHCVVECFCHFCEDTPDVVLQMMSSALQHYSKSEVSSIAAMLAAGDHKHKNL